MEIREHSKQDVLPESCSVLKMFWRLWVSKMLETEAESGVVLFQKMPQKERRVELRLLELSLSCGIVGSPHSRTRLDRDLSLGSQIYVKRLKARL